MWTFSPAVRPNSSGWTCPTTCWWACRAERFLAWPTAWPRSFWPATNFHTDLLDDDDFDRMPSPIPAGYDFANLQLLDLSRTQLKIFKGVWVKNIRNLTDLDISCNKFKRVTKEFFTALPSSLRKLNMSFCATNMLMSPDIVEDAFSTLGAMKNEKKNIKNKTKKQTRKYEENIRGQNRSVLSERNMSLTVQNLTERNITESFIHEILTELNGTEGNSWVNWTELNGRLLANFANGTNGKFRSVTVEFT